MPRSRRARAGRTAGRRCREKPKRVLPAVFARQHIGPGRFRGQGAMRQAAFLRAPSFFVVAFAGWFFAPDAFGADFNSFGFLGAKTCSASVSKSGSFSCGMAIWSESRMTIGEEAEVADADEAAREQMEQEAAQELVHGQAHDALPVAMRGVSPAEADLALSEGNEPPVDDADPVGVGAEIAQNVLRSAEGPLGVDDPVVTEETPEPGSEAAWLCQRCEMALEV